VDRGLAGRRRGVPAGDGRHPPLPGVPRHRRGPRRPVRAQRDRWAGAGGRDRGRPRTARAGRDRAGPAVPRRVVAGARARPDRRPLRHPLEPRLRPRADHAGRGDRRHRGPGDHHRAGAPPAKGL
ncbi:MAG: hypothetical protein AVDCRST_MAG54-3881, partial [uncultured Actinomycetospora sp.]